MYPLAKETNLSKFNRNINASIESIMLEMVSKRTLVVFHCAELVMCTTISCEIQFMSRTSCTKSVSVAILTRKTLTVCKLYVTEIQGCCFSVMLKSL